MILATPAADRHLPFYAFSAAVPLRHMLFRHAVACHAAADAAAVYYFAAFVITLIFTRHYFHVVYALRVTPATLAGAALPSLSAEHADAVRYLPQPLRDSLRAAMFRRYALYARHFCHAMLRDTAMLR